jgi:hypothetical protein
VRPTYLWSLFVECVADPFRTSATLRTFVAGRSITTSKDSP